MAELNVRSREETGKEQAKKLRRNGLIPAVVYGYRGNRMISVSAIEFEKIFEEIGEHSILTLNVGDEKGKIDVIVKAFQLDPIKKHIIHIDFLQFQEDKLLRTEVPLRVEGVSMGVKKGGILEVFVRDIEIECLPRDIPDSITVPIDDMDIGDSVHVRDLPSRDEVKILMNPEQVVVAIGMPTKIEVPVEEEEEEVVAVEGEAPEAPAEEKEETEEEKE
jgi:large subunit ribosomal protein L25